MSAAHPIVLLDDDGEEGEKQNDLDTVTMTVPSHVVDSFLEVMPGRSTSYATNMLARSNGNLEQALILALEGDVEQRRITTCDPQHDAPTSSAADHAATSSATATSPPASLTYKHSYTTLVGSNKSAQDTGMLSDEWHRHVKMMKATGSSVFVDPDFSPVASSLDGRKHQQHDTANCLCRIPAKAQSVQRDGKNYGRFYLSCGNQSRDNNAKCGFFQWDKDGSGGTTRYSGMTWHCFGFLPQCSIGPRYGPHQVNQGAVGNCWFLSALAVVAEKEHLIQNLFPHTQLNAVGCYQVNLCLDGKWTPVIIDSYLPVMERKRKQDSHFVEAAFCAVPNGQLWPALIEKAYAKAHGSYAQLSGGFIAEAFMDMTGAPTETIVFSNDTEWKELLWTRLLSFHQAGFLMGVATSRGGDGLVGGHAYSVLDVLEFQNVLVGGQPLVSDFFSNGPPPKRARQKTTVRLVRIRNPWGKREWKGEWSVASDKWTTALRKRLGDKSFAKGDGTFFMSYHDMLERFHHMDVAKCRKGWKHLSVDGRFRRETSDSLVSSQQVYSLNVSERTWAFISLIQPKKRANTKTQYWYGDPSMLILKRRKGVEETWSCESSAIHGCTRSCTGEIFLDPSYDYACVPLSYNSQNIPFRVTCYSSEEVTIAAKSRDGVDDREYLNLLHRELIRKVHKVHYAIASKGLLMCIHGQDCLYFLVLNASPDHYLSVRLTLDVKKGMLLAYGQSGDTHDIPPRAQKILMVALSDGTDSTAASVTFSYVCDTVATVNRSGSIMKGPAGIGSVVDLSIAGDLIAGEVSSDVATSIGCDTVETHHWLSQLGSGHTVA